MYCSRLYAEKLLRKNRLETDYPAVSYQKLVRMFSNTAYNDFFLEEMRKANEFFYNIKEDNNNIWLEPSYELVFLPYSECLDEVDPEPVHDFMFGYRIMTTRGYMPGEYDRIYGHANVYSMEYILEHLKRQASTCKKFAEEHKWSEERLFDPYFGLGETIFSDFPMNDTYQYWEFAQAELRDFIDNDGSTCFGPACPDRMLCYNSYANIVRTLMMDIDKLGLVPDKEAESYELKVVAYVSAILTILKEDPLIKDKKFSKAMLKKEAKRIFESYISNIKQEDISELCRQIKMSVVWKQTIVMDFSKYKIYDYDDILCQTAPLGLTNEDMERFEDDEFFEDMDDQETDDDLIIDDDLLIDEGE